MSSSHVGRFKQCNGVGMLVEDKLSPKTLGKYNIGRMHAAQHLGLSVFRSVRNIFYNFDFFRVL